MTQRKLRQPELTYEEARQYSNHLMDVLKKNTLPLTVMQLNRSLANVFGINSQRQTQGFVASFLQQWQGWTKKVKLPNREVGYRWI